MRLVRLVIVLFASPFAATGLAQEIEESATAETFDVWEFRVLGNSVLPAASVERAVYAKLGPDRTIEDVEAARMALETAYRDAGFSTVFVDIPEQTVDAGIVRLSVTEGQIDRVRVTGARYFSNRQILAALPSLQRGEVPHFPEVQEQLADLNRQTPDRSVTPVLRAGRYPGTVDMELRVQVDLPFHGDFEISNRYTADTTELRTNLNLSYTNLWQKEHTATLQWQVSPEETNETNVLAATYVAPLERSDNILAFYAVDSDSDVATLGTLAVLGKGSIFGARGILPFESIGNFNHNLTLGIDFKDFDESILLEAEDGLNTAIKYVNWSASYGFGWTGPRASTALTVAAAWGIRGAGNNDLEFEEKRFRARGNYAYLSGSVTQSINVFGDAQFVTRGSWQYAVTPLISNEQFAAGGAMSVRGYLEAERLGDRGAGLSLELYSPPLLRSRQAVESFRVVGFYDNAALRVVDPLPGQDAYFRLEGVGAGLRFLGLNGLEVEVDWAKPLVDGANVAEGEDRVHFRLNYGF